MAQKSQVGVGSAGSASTSEMSHSSRRASISATAAAFTLLPPRDTPPLNSRMADSQSTAKSAIIDAPAPAKEPAASAETASPYGTRSRNRTGQSRPNYAEDKDVDMDYYEPPPEKRSVSKRVVSQATSAASDGEQPQRQNARRPLPGGADGPATKAAPKDDAAAAGGKTSPASSSQAQPTASSATSNSKKRKSGANSGLSNSNSQPAAAASAPATNGTSKRPAPTSASTPGTGASSPMPPLPPGYHRGYAESNMMTFENSGALLKNGKLIADDGTTLERNGKPSPYMARAACPASHHSTCTLAASFHRRMDHLS